MKHRMCGTRKTASRTLQSGQSVKHTLWRPSALRRVDHGEKHRHSHRDNYRADRNKRITG